jgi:hypothetical protein
MCGVFRKIVYFSDWNMYGYTGDAICNIQAEGETYYHRHLRWPISELDKPLVEPPIEIISSVSAERWMLNGKLSKCEVG